MPMKCPFCGVEMTPGVIQSRDGVYWSREAGAVAALAVLKKDAITLADSGSSVFGGAAAEALTALAAKKSSWTTPFAISRYKIPNFPLAKPENWCYHTLRQQGSSPERAESGLSSPRPFNLIWIMPT